MTSEGFGPNKHAARFQRLVALVGMVTRCDDCRRQGYLAKVGVEHPNERPSKRRYFAVWEHPDGEGCTALCEWVWP